MSIYDKIKKFLRTPGIEGPAQTIGYIPCRPANYTGYTDPDRYTAIGVSGVTVATGFDIGQKTVHEMRAEIKLPEEIIHKLSPYAGLRGRKAIEKLHKKPVLLDKEEAEVIDNLYIEYYNRRYVAPTYNRDSKLDYDSIPEKARVVIHSILFQRGPGYVRRMPICWGFLVEGDWNGAADELINGTWPNYRLRRKYEGVYLCGKDK